MKKYIAILMLMMCIPLVLVGCADKQPDSTDQFSAEEETEILTYFQENFVNIYNRDLLEYEMLVEENEEGVLVVTLNLSTDFDEDVCPDTVDVIMFDLIERYPDLSYTLELDEPFAYVYIIKT